MLRIPASLLALAVLFACGAQDQEFRSLPAPEASPALEASPQEDLLAPATPTKERRVVSRTTEDDSTIESQVEVVEVFTVRQMRDANGRRWQEPMAARVRVGIGWEKQHLPHPEHLSAPFVEVATDDKGYAQVELSIEGTEGTGRRLMGWARSIEKGWNGRLARGRKHEEGPLRLRVVMTPGKRVRGRVVDEDGNGVEGAWIGWSNRDPEYLAWRTAMEADGGSFSLFTSKSAEDGYFEISLEQGELGRLYATKPLTGAAGLSERRTEDVPEELEFVLRGEGSLAGRLVDADGQGMGRYRLHAVPENCAPRWYDRRDLLEEDRGRYAETLETENDGSFRFTGLAPGRYVFLGDQGNGVLEQLDTSFFDTPSADVVLRAGSLHQIVVQVLDEQARRLRHGVRVSCIAVENLPTGTPRWSFETCMWSFNTFMEQEYGEVDPAGDLRFVVPPGRDYIVTIRADRAALHEERVTVQSGNHLVRVKHVLARDIPPGHIRARLNLPPGGRFANEVEVALFTKEGNERVAGGSTARSGPAFEEDVPPGCYVLRASEGPVIQLCSTGLTFRPLHIASRPTEREVEIRSGETTLVDLEYDLGGIAMLEIEKRYETVEANAPTANATSEWASQTPIEKWLEVHMATLVVRDTRGPVQPLGSTWSVLEQPGQAPVLALTGLDEGTYHVTLRFAGDVRKASIDVRTGKKSEARLAPSGDTGNATR